MRAPTQLIVLFCLGTLGIVPAAADAAAVQLDRSCYLTGGVVKISGTGFAPNATVTVTQNETQVGSTNTDTLGSFQATYNALEVSEASRQADITVSATDGATTAQATGRVTVFNADFSPGQGNPRTLKVRFVLDGFNLLAPDPVGQPSTVYLHYVAPGGKLKTTKRLGKAQGVCGALSTKKTKLFPFAARRGLWSLQWDTRKSYRKCTRDADFLCFVRSVRVFQVKS